MVLLIFVGFVLAFAVSLGLLRFARRHMRHYPAEAPQRFHLGHVPRLGGVAMLVGLMVSLALSLLSPVAGVDANIDFGAMMVGAWLATLLPSVAGGFYEDMTQRLRVSWRLLLTLTSGLAGWLFFDIQVPRLGIESLDAIWVSIPALPVLLAILAVTGLPHAFNIIDGYNGLAATVAMVVCLAIAHVALQVGDRQLAALVLCLAGATGGFLVWNYPRGLIFAGDGGAYLWGVVIAMACITLVQRHAEVSPWFPVLLLIYPVWETLFSIYRKASRGVSPGVADALHFHQLIFRRIVRGVFDDDESRMLLIRNNRTSPYLWGFTLLTVAPAVLFWRNTVVLMLFTTLFVVTYTWIYLSIIRFRVPRWLGVRRPGEGNGNDQGAGEDDDEDDSSGPDYPR